MANRVTISTLCCAPCRADGKRKPEQWVAPVADYLRSRIGQVLPDKPDLIVLPEMCDRLEEIGDDRLVDYYRARGDRILHVFQAIAKKNRCYLTYPCFREMPDGTWRNSVLMIDRRGKVIGAYNKNHLMPEEHTERHALYGRAAAIFECDFGRVACAICFDLNFDELLGKHQAAKPDLVVFCSLYHGGLRQRYWAYACRAHFVSALGGLGSPWGAIINPLGEVIAHTTNYFDFVTATVNLDCRVAHLDGNWAKLTALKAKYGPGVTLFDPGYLSPVLITSETARRTARQMAAEFKIELLDDYFARASALRHAPGRMEA